MATSAFLFTKKSTNRKALLQYKYLKFNFSVAGLKLQPFFQSSKWLKNGSDFCPKRRMGSRTKLLFQFFSPWSNTAHHLMSHIFGNKSDHKFLHQKDHILVITLIVKKDIRQRINVHLENVMKTTDFEAEEICSQSEASNGQKPFFSRFSAFLHLDGHILVIRLIVKKDFGKSKNGHLEKVMETTDFETEKVCPQS